MTKSSKYGPFLVLSSSVTMIFGFALVAFSFFLLFDQTNMLEIVEPTHYRNGLYIAAFGGILLVIICLMAFFGVGLYDRFLIILTCGLSILIALLIFIAAVLVLVFDSRMGSSAIRFMEHSLISSYNRTSLITNAWDEVQSRLRCCAVSDKGWGLYRDSYWMANEIVVRGFNTNLSEWSPFVTLVPVSCCFRPIDGLTGWPGPDLLNQRQCQQFKFGPPRFPDGAFNDAIYYRGCFNAMRSFIRHYSGWMGALCLVSDVAVIVGIVACFLFLSSDSSRKEE